MTTDEIAETFRTILRMVTSINPVEGFPGYTGISLASGHIIFIGRGVFVVLDPDTDGGPHGIEKLKALLRFTHEEGDPAVL
jgi:hypothetical protein